jgi:phosphoglycolate phosphatase
VRLILFDVDGTLVTCAERLRPLFLSAVAEAAGVEPSPGVSFAGKTDPQIVVELLVKAGWRPAAALREVLRIRGRYLRKLEAAGVGDGIRCLPGVEPLLERLAGCPGVALGLLTGNWEAGARLKLGQFDLNRFFPFGAFGGDGHERRDLVPVALRRAARVAGRRFAPEATVLVGDTVRDVAAARAHGIRTVAVATGPESEAELTAAGAEWVLRDLTEAVRAEPLATG